jgi:transcriptional regulator with XRE-family HTH domain
VPTTWNLRERRDTFLRQMADHARGERLRQLRAAHNLSQEDVARALGVTTKTYGAWENGGGIRPTNARRIGRYFKVKPGELIDPEIQPEHPYELTRADLDRLKRIEENLDERLKRVEEGMDEILKRLRRSDEDRPEVPDRLPPAQDPEPDDLDDDAATGGAS